MFYKNFIERKKERELASLNVACNYEHKGISQL